MRPVIDAHESGSHSIKCWFFIVYETIDGADLVRTRDGHNGFKEQSLLPETTVEVIGQPGEFTLHCCRNGPRPVALAKQIFGDVQRGEYSHSQRRLLGKFAMDGVDHLVHVRRHPPREFFALPPQGIFRAEYFDSNALFVRRHSSTHPPLRDTLRSLPEGPSPGQRELVAPRFPARQMRPLPARRS
jgi:hypothetical protein